MFSIIDSKLLNISQWVMRQYELSTSSTRGEIIKEFLFLTRSTLLIFVTFVILRWIFYPPLLFFGFLLAYMMFFATKQFERVFKSQKIEPGILPKEIITRVRKRSMLLLVSVSNVVIFVFSQEKIGWFLSLYLSFFLLLCLEYLICTTSLPPGEKERKKQEREIKGMDLQHT